MNPTPEHKMAATPEEIDARVDAWCANSARQTLWDALGWSRDEFRVWLNTQTAPARPLAERKIHAVHRPPIG
jgi:hypothetical protein